jgi:AraC family transcriptional regulator
MTTNPANAPLTQRDYKKRLLRVLVHIQGHLDEPLDLVELARVACFSPFHFHRVFSGMIGETVKAHVRRLRLERAASQLKYGRLAVTQIGLAAGYETHEAFTRAFKAAFGAAPSAFRSQKSATARVAAPSEVHWNNALDDFRSTRLTPHAMNVQIKTVPPRRVAFMRHAGPYDRVGETWDRLLTTLGKDGWLGGDTLIIGVCHDDPEVTPPAKIRYDACVTVNETFKPEGDIGVQILPGGPCAVATHAGPYNALGKTYSKLFGEWLPRSGRQLADRPAFEVYLNSPETEAPEDLLTDIHMPLV